MTKYLLSLTASFCLALLPQASWSQTGVVLQGGGATGTSKTGTQQGVQVKSLEGAGGSASYTPSTVVNPDVSKVSGMENNAKDAASKQSSGQAAALAAMAAMMAVAAATCPACGTRGTCPICIASTIGAAASGLTAGNMAGAKAKSNTQFSNVTPTQNTANNPQYAERETIDAARKEIEKNLKGSGVKVSSDLKKITTADGRTLEVDDAFSGGAGLTGSEAAELLKLKPEIQAAAAKAAGAGIDATPGEEGDTFGGGGKSGGSASEAVLAASGAASLNSRNVASVAGTFKDFNGDRIGVAADSMFRMINRRYGVEASKDNFIVSGK